MRRDFEDLGGADPWALLGVGRDAPVREVQRAYRLLAKRYHPDSPTGDVARFKKVSLAYEILSAPARATDYALRLREESEQECTPPPYFDTTGGDPGAGRAGGSSAGYRPYEPPPPYDDIPEPSPRARAEPSWWLHEPPPPVVVPRTVNVFAVVSLVLTVFLCLPVSFGFAIAALAQIQRTGQRGAGLAWTAILISAVVAFFICCALGNGARLWSTG